MLLCPIRTLRLCSCLTWVPVPQIDLPETISLPSDNLVKYQQITEEKHVGPDAMAGQALQFGGIIIQP